MKKTDIEAVWAILCGSSSVDSDSNNISIYKVLERLSLTKGDNPPPTGPHLIPLEHEYVVLLQRSGSIAKKETYPLTIRLRGPNRDVLSEAAVPAVFDTEKKRLRIRIQNNAFPIAGAGEYRFEVYLEGIETPLTTTPLDVLIN